MISLFFLALLAVARGSEDYFKPVEFESCDGNYKVTKVEATNCKLGFENHRPICVFRILENPKIRVHFKPTDNGKDLWNFIRIQVGDSTLKKNLKETQSCRPGGLLCPLESGKEYSFEQEIPISSTYAHNDLLHINWQIARKNAQTPEVCIKLTAKVDKPEVEELAY